MEQSSGKTGRLILAAGIALALAAAALQYFSPASREIMAGRDLRVALLGGQSCVLLVYHPFSDTVNAFTRSGIRAPKGASSAQRAEELALAALGDAAEKKTFYVSLDTALELDSLWATLNNWRSDPRRLLRAGSWVYGLKVSGSTDLAWFDLFSVFSGFLRLGSSNFIVTEVPRRGAAPGPAPEESGVSGAPRVEVFNASGMPGLASRTAKRLRAQGFDVITEGTYATREKHTRVLNFSADPAAALRLRQALGLEGRELLNSSRKSVAGAAVVLGQDFAEGTYGK